MKPGSQGSFGWSMRLATPMVYWVLISCVSTLVGIDSIRALPEIAKTSVQLLLPFCVLTSLSCVSIRRDVFLGRIKVYLISMVVSHVVAACYRIINVGFDGVLTSSLKPPGPVTESGQLVLVLAATMALLFLALEKKIAGAKSNVSVRSVLCSDKIIFLSVFVGMLLIAWPDVFGLAKLPFSAVFIQISLVAVFFGVCLPRFVVNCTKLHRGPGAWNRLDTVEFRRLIWFLAAVLSAVFVVNLKRGPWFGLCLELLVIGLLLSRRVIFIALSFVFIVVFSLGPARSRLEHLLDDFSISGGRQYMWTIGVELARRFPLGLGPDNASVMRELDPSLPELHRHMHNNLLNVAVESGWIGMIVYLWWMYIAVVMGFFAWKRLRKSSNKLDSERSVLALFLACALLGWQAAGLVEYNFGDGEVCMIALFFMGLLLGLVSFDEAHGVEKLESSTV